jgi:hypothetical protein
MKTLLKSMKDEMKDDRQRYSEREFYGEIGFGGVLIERLSVCPSANSPAS